MSEVWGTYGAEGSYTLGFGQQTKEMRPLRKSYLVADGRIILKSIVKKFAGKA